MNRNIFKRIFRILAVNIFVLLTSIFSIVQANTLTIGTISIDPIDEMRTFQPLSDYLSQTLAKDGVNKIKIIIASNIPDAVELLKTNQIDIFIDSSVTALIINELSGSKFMLRRWKKARDKYRSVISVNTASGILSLKDLVGKAVAFEEPFSTSGYFLPALAILQSGLELSELSNPRTKPASGKVGYVMAHDNETQITWLERNRVAAVAMAESDYKKFSESALNPMMVIHSTLYVPYHVVVHRDGLDPILIQTIKAVLTSAHETTDGQVAMREFENTSLFDEIPENLLSDLKSLKKFLSSLNLTSPRE